MDETTTGAKTYLGRTMRASDVVQALRGFCNADLLGEAGTDISGIAHARSTAEDAIVHASGTFADQAATFRRTVICEPSNADRISASARIVVADARGAFIKLLEFVEAEIGIDYQRTLREQTRSLEEGPSSVHSSAIIEADVLIGTGAQIGANVVIMRGSVIGEGSIVRAGTVIGEAGSALHTFADGNISPQPHVGTTLIGRNCEIGTHCSVIRAMLGKTEIGADSRLGNYVNIGHGVSIGARAWVAVGSKIGGHTRVGDGVTIGMGAVVRNDITIGEAASIAMGSVVTKGLPPDANAFGNPARIVTRKLSTGPLR
jgi:UDP-3-O-[3-hydroxymyristoyl] glucosamine N-acyltransferase